MDRTTDTLSRLMEHCGLGEIKRGLEFGLSLEDMSRELENQRTEDNRLFSLFKPLSEFEEQEAKWLVEGWIPEGQITLLAADGGVGKTSLWCNLTAGISCGNPTILDSPSVRREPKRVMFLTTEDSIRKKLKRKLRLAGVDMGMVFAPDFQNDPDGILRKVKFGSDELAQIVRYFRPALCVFDPLQGFVPPDINMGQRNAMRDCMAPLVALGEEVGTSFLVVCHSNKRKAASGRDRIADSADLWDISRSVMMAGHTETDGVRYLSNEKNNYTALHETLLFSIDGEGQLHQEGTSWKRDREFQAESTEARSAPKRDDCKEFLVKTLEQYDGKLPVKELEKKAVTAGYSPSTIRRAKDGLRIDGTIRFARASSKRTAPWLAVLSAGSQQVLVALPDTTETPWT